MKDAFLKAASLIAVGEVVLQGEPSLEEQYP